MRADTVDRYYNVGTGGRTSLADLAEALLRLTGADLEVRYEPRSEATLVTNRIGCPQLAEDELGFTAATGLEDGLSDLIRWRSEQPDIAAEGAA
jgi:UDP-glucose 4-epimerase